MLVLGTILIYTIYNVNYINYSFTTAELNLVTIENLSLRCHETYNSVSISKVRNVN